MYLCMCVCIYLSVLHHVYDVIFPIGWFPGSATNSVWVGLTVWFALWLLYFLSLLGLQQFRLRGPNKSWYLESRRTFPERLVVICAPSGVSAEG